MKKIAAAAGNHWAAGLFGLKIFLFAAGSISDDAKPKNSRPRP
jgi:hypothetical protein